MLIHTDTIMTNTTTKAKTKALPQPHHFSFGAMKNLN